MLYDKEKYYTRMLISTQALEKLTHRLHIEENSSHFHVVVSSSVTNEMNVLRQVPLKVTKLVNVKAYKLISTT